MVTGHMKLYCPRFQEVTVEILVIEKTCAESGFEWPYKSFKHSHTPATVIIKCGVQIPYVCYQGGIFSEINFNHIVFYEKGGMKGRGEKQRETGRKWF